MTGTEGGPQPRSRKLAAALDWILWWRVRPEELTRQVEGYATLHFVQTARGISFLLCMLSAFATSIAIPIAGMDPAAFLDVVLFLVFGLFILAGHRWALAAMMLLWTAEKAMIAMSPVAGLRTNAVVQLLWWAIYMHAFTLALRVENRHRRERLASLSEEERSAFQSAVRSRRQTVGGYFALLLIFFAGVAVSPAGTWAVSVFSYAFLSTLVLYPAYFLIRRFFGRRAP